MSQFHFTPDSYLEMIRADVERFDEFQDAIADATRSVEARAVLELGTGTGETARRVLQHHQHARLVGIDESESMLAHARLALPDTTVLRTSRVQEPLPEGPFDLVFSALTVHHLNPAEKADLFQRIATVLAPGGVFVLGDVVAPERAEDAVTPLTEDFDLPDSVADQLGWLAEAGFRPDVTWAWKDLAVISARASAPPGKYAPTSGPRSRGARAHSRPCQGSQPWLRTSAASDLVLATPEAGQHYLKGH